MYVPKHSDETTAVWAAASSWSYLRKKGTKIKKTSLSVDQHDTRNRIIINPITDEDYKLVGLAGLIVAASGADLQTTIKRHTKFARQNGIHVSPTFIEE